MRSATWTKKDKREKKDLNLKTIFQVGNNIRDSTSVLSKEVLVAHDGIVSENYIRPDTNGTLIQAKRDVVKTLYSRVYVCPSFAVVDKKENVHFVRDALRRALDIQKDTIYPAYLDMKRIVDDHPEQWVRGFTDRKGHVQRGTVYGAGVEKDVVYGDDFDRSRSKSVGWETDFFGPPVKIRVSQSPVGGTVMVFTEPSAADLLQFIETEILNRYDITSKF